MLEIFAVARETFTFKRKISMFETSKPIYIGIAVFFTLAFLVSLLLYRQSINIIVVLLPGLIAAATFGVLAWRLGIQNRELRNTIREKEEVLLRLQTTSHRSLEHLYRLFHFTSALNDSIMHAKDESSLYVDVCRIACKTGKFKLAWIGLVSEEEQSVIPFTSCGENTGYVTAIGRIPLTSATADGPVLRLIRTGEFVKCNDIARDPMYKTWAR
ncbi:MAG: GAF domain-containing protein, partial [Bacteroidota bacterium]|nr:GAF domain-containing protein [Bacteroidota bacterium]